MSARCSRSPPSPQPRDYGKHFKALLRPDDRRRANASTTAARTSSTPRSTFCDEWNRGTADDARFELEYLLAVGTRV